MGNIVDYLDWRGDVTFECDPFNEVDNLVFSVLSYLDFAGVVPDETQHDSVSLAEVAARIAEMPEVRSAPVTESFFVKLPVLLEKAAACRRFKDVRLSHYINRIKLEKPEQFSAVVVSLNPEAHFVAFSGTDDTLAGWKEDLEMSFMEEVPAQKSAAEYLNMLMTELAGDFYMGGHSKGGNLAVFAGASVSQIFQERIRAIFNDDGPGFQSGIIQSEGYQKILKKVTTFLPESSIVGMLLEHRGEYKVISSAETGLMQHNAFSWQVSGNRFVSEEGLSKSSLLIHNTIRSWLDKVSHEERSEFIDAFFEILQASGAETVRELSHEKISAAKAMIQTYRELEPETQNILKNTLEIFFSEGRKVFQEELGSLIASKLPGKKADKGDQTPKALEA